MTASAMVNTFLQLGGLTCYSSRHWLYKPDTSRSSRGCRRKSHQSGLEKKRKSERALKWRTAQGFRVRKEAHNNLYNIYVFTTELVILVPTA